MRFVPSAQTEPPTVRDQVERDALALALAEWLLWILGGDEQLAQAPLAVAAERQEQRAR